LCADRCQQASCLCRLLARLRVVLFVAACLAAAGCEHSQGNAEAPTSSPAPETPTDAAAPVSEPPAEATSASAPASEPVWPDAQLIAQCRQDAEALRGRLDDTFAVTVSPPFVVAGNMPLTALRNDTRHSVVAPAEAMWTSYFRRRPDQVITVLLFADADSYRTWAKKLFGDDDLPHFGYYRSRDRTLVMNISTGTGTLVHELTHALIVYDFPGVPTWFNEGLASLHEQCRVRPDGIEGLENWRLPALQKAIRNDSLRPLKDLLTRRDFRGPLQGLNYAQVRYFVMYMQQKRKLREFYAYFRDHYGRAGDDVRAVEHVFGEDLSDIDRSLRRWVLTLRFPPDH